VLSSLGPTAYYFLQGAQFNKEPIMKQYFSVKNWDKFQHYKDRNPPWIKLHNSLLDNYEFECLQDASKSHLLCIWMLASRTDNKMPLDQDWIKRKIGASSKVDLQILLDHGFIELQGMLQDASKTLVSEEKRQRRDREETEKSKDTSSSSIEDNQPVKAACQYEKILSLYHSILPSHPAVRILSNARKSAIKGRWMQDKKFQDIEFWEKLFNHVSTSDFLTGRVPPSAGRKQFIADLDFITSPKGFVGIVEGKYDN